MALERAEKIKQLISINSLPAFPEIPKDDFEDEKILRDDEKNLEPALNDQTSNSSTSSGTLEQSELKILGITSKINNLSFVPFLKSDLKERFSYPIPFT
jgi:hypothetical protein